MKKVLCNDKEREWLMELKSVIVDDFNIYNASYDTPLTLRQYWQRYRNQYIRYRSSHKCTTFRRK